MRDNKNLKITVRSKILFLLFSGIKNLNLTKFGNRSINSHIVKYNVTEIKIILIIKP